MGKGKTYTIYTDGSSDNRVKTELRIATGAFLIRCNGEYLDEGVSIKPYLTSNGAELFAAAEGLKRLKEITTLGKWDRVIIKSDSDYVVKTITTYMPFFRFQDFMDWDRGVKVDRKNKDLLIELSDLMFEFNISARHIKGHSNNEYNDYVHDLAYGKRKEILQKLEQNEIC